MKKKYLSSFKDIKPCPFCGNHTPWGYINDFFAYLGCENCGFSFGTVKVIYAKDKLPKELKGYEYEKDFKKNTVRVNPVVLFDHAGILKKWNNRI